MNSLPDITTLELTLLTFIVAQHNRTLNDLVLIKEFLYEIASKSDIQIDQNRLLDNLTSVDEEVNEEQQEILAEILGTPLDNHASSEEEREEAILALLRKISLN